MKEAERKRPQEEVVSVILHMESINAMIDNKDLYLLYFVEDIYSSCMAGKIQFADPYGAYELGPITGNEKLTILFGAEEDIQREFVIYKVQRIEQLSSFERGGMQVFEIFFVDSMFYDLNYKSYSRSWGVDTSISQIVSDICEHMLDNPDLGQFETSNETLANFYMPDWTPREALKWLMRRASGTSSGQAGYLFYNNIEGTNFVTIDKLLLAKVMDETKFTLRQEADIYSIHQILGWAHLGLDTTSMRHVRGGTVKGYDSSTKTFVEDTHTYFDSIAQHVLLGGFSIYPDISDELAVQTLDGDPNKHILKNINQNNFISRYNRQMLVEITVPGSVRDRYCGGLIEIDWPSTLPGIGRVNEMMKGYYLVKSITHQWSPQQSPVYMQKMVLIKNAYTHIDAFNVIPLVKSTKKNLAADTWITTLRARIAGGGGL